MRLFTIFLPLMLITAGLTSLSSNFIYDQPDIAWNLASSYLLVSIGSAILWISVLVEILKNEFIGYNKIIWFLVTFLFPPLGVVLYFFIGQKQKVENAPMLS